MTLCAAYASTNKYFRGKKLALVFLLIPFYFSGGLIPSYLLVTGLGLRNSLFALILPGSINIYYILVFRNIMARLPSELPESAEIDGAGQPRILLSIILPLVVTTVAAFAVFSAVAEWNSWFGCLIYITDRRKWTLQFQLREILISASLHDAQAEHNLFLEEMIHPDNLRMAALMCTILPIIGVYPFMQRYFVHGVLIGVLKG